jgi:hypothetical protein
MPIYEQRFGHLSRYARRSNLRKRQSFFWPQLMLTLYSTEGCHLCELALHLLTEDVGVPEAQIMVIDIATDDELIDQFGVYIPVLENPITGDRLFWPFSATDVTSYLKTQHLSG